MKKYLLILVFILLCINCTKTGTNPNFTVDPDTTITPHIPMSQDTIQVNINDIEN